jgi:UDP-2-acetamido-3-amino-2,3-dideoxy-glucuronate N-acetyltransferase
MARPCVPRPSGPAASSWWAIFSTTIPRSWSSRARRGGALGRVNYIYSNRLNFGKIRTREDALWSFAPHDIGVILRLVGEMPVEVTCSGGSYITPNLADVTISCLHFRMGVRAHIFVSWLNPFKEQKLVVVGDRKMAVFNDLLKEDKLILYDQRVDLNDRQPVLPERRAGGDRRAAEEPLQKECEHFLECVRTRRAPISAATKGSKFSRCFRPVRSRCS